MSKWFDNNNLTLNYNKIKVLIFVCPNTKVDNI